jgi:hypothetical protein
MLHAHVDVAVHPRDGGEHFLWVGFWHNTEDLAQLDSHDRLKTASLDPTAQIVFSSVSNI